MNKLFLMLLSSLCILSGCRKSTQVERTTTTSPEIEEKRISGPEYAGVEQEKEDYR